jgi:hypothetical protein
MLTRALVGLAMLAAAGCASAGAAATSPPPAGCHAVRAGQPAPGPVPRTVARRLPAGVFDVLAGPNDTSLNLWQVSNTGCERRLTRAHAPGRRHSGARTARYLKLPLPWLRRS